MKLKLLLLIVISLMLFSCQKEDIEITEYFSEPLLTWSYSKSDVLSKETRVLIGDTSPDEIVYMVPPFVKGDGSLKYSDSKEYINSVAYGFYSESKTLVQVFIEFVSNSEIEAELFYFMKTKYGKFYDESIHEQSKTYTWNKPGMIVTMERESYGLYVRCLKDPL